MRIGCFGPRPCFTEALLTHPYGGTCPVRSTFCYVNNGGRGERSGFKVVVLGLPKKNREEIKK
jgi:hypothetical protein